MMIRTLILILCLALASTSYAGNTPSGASALEQVGTWMGDQLGSYISSGCLPTVPASSMTLAPLACRGAVRLSTGALRYVSQTAVPITLTGASGRFFLALHSDQQTAVTGWTRTPGSHYLWQRFTGTNVQLPAAPANAQLVVEITVAGGVVTAVTDRRRPASLASSGVCELTDPLFGAVGDGTADDTAAVQAAANNYACGVVTGAGGAQYRVTSTLTITRHFRFVGMGAGPGGAISPDTRYQGMTINHDFNGTLFYIPGILNDVITPLGFELENMILRQVFGTNSAAAGTAIHAVGVTSNFRPTWLKVHNVNIEQGSAADSWTWGILVDGTPILTGGVGLRDTFFSNMRIVNGDHSTGAIGLYAATNARLSTILLNGVNCHVFLSGVAGNPGQLTHMNNMQGTCGLFVDWATGNSCYDCSFATLAVSGNTISYSYRGNLSGEPTIDTGAVAVSVESAGVMYLSGDNNRLYKYKAIDGNETRLGIDSTAGIAAYTSWLDAGTEKWAMGKAADNSFFFNGAAAQQILAVDTAGLLTTKRGTAKAGKAPAYGPTVSIDAREGDLFLITVTDNVNFTITTTNNITNQVLTIIIVNNSGGAMGAITWDASIFRLAGAFTNPATGFQRALTFRCSGLRQQEIARNEADVDKN